MSALWKIFVMILTIFYVKGEIDFLNAYLNLYKEGFQQHKNRNFINGNNFSYIYDFIIVGAGTAGGVLANRLSEIAEWNILLIEAGVSEEFYSDIPIFVAGENWMPINWNYKMEPGERYCLGFTRNRCYCPRGKVMGGSSVLNFMIYTRGNRRDYDLWSDLGNDGWSWNEVLPYFKKVEKFSIPENFDAEYHGYKGYLDVGYDGYLSKAAEGFLNATQEAGYNYIDYNGKYQIGTSRLQFSIKNGRRMSSNMAYITPVMSRRNLHVLKSAMVTRLLINEKNKVYGVEFFRHNTKHKVFCAKEVIVSGGAINSPQLLMLSGIGPKDELEKFTIPAKKELMVGHNFMDHIAAVVTFTATSAKENFNFNIFEMSLKWLKDSIVDYSNGKGAMSVPGAAESLTFINLQNTSNIEGWPDVELLLITSSMNSNFLREYFDIDLKLYRENFANLDANRSFMVFPMVMRPKSRGRVRLRSGNPFTHPSIYPNYYDHENDVKTVLGGIREALKLVNSPSFKKLGVKVHEAPLSTCKMHPFGSDDYWTCYAMHFTFSIFHLSGTCKMGPKSDSSAVVSPRLKVYGVEGLRVIDASVIPVIPTAHTNAPTYMIAEKGADMIKQDWGKLN